MPMYEAEQVHRLLADLGVHPHRLRGQNFLLDEAVVERILAAASPTAADAVLEIGPGLGVLSRGLAEQAGRLFLLELEPAFAERLADRFAFEEQVEVIQADAVTFDYEAFCRERQISGYQLVANLPYNITTPFLRRLLLEGGPWERATLMLQKEAAQRVCAGPGRDNGPLPLLTQYRAEATILFDVPREAFYPAPAVCSSVIRLTRRSQPPVEAEPMRLMALIEAAFSQRRKQLVNNLCGCYHRADGSALSREQVTAALESCGFPATVRGEALTLADFAALLARLG